MSKHSESEESKKLSGKKYMKHLRKLQAELCHLQEWVKHKGLRVIVVFEGRDAAGKGGAIRAITERVSPRVFRLVALPAPSDRGKGQCRKGLRRRPIPFRTFSYRKTARLRPSPVHAAAPRAGDLFVIAMDISRRGNCAGPALESILRKSRARQLPACPKP